MTNTDNVDGQECWDMSSNKYCTAAVTNVESVLENCGVGLFPNCVTPLSSGYHTYMDMKGEIKADRF